MGGKGHWQDWLPGEGVKERPRGGRRGGKEQEKADQKEARREGGGEAGQEYDLRGREGAGGAELVTGLM